MDTLPDNVATLIDVLRFRATYEPDQLAYLFLTDGETGEISLTYADLDQNARAIAATLQRRIAFGDRVLLLYPSGLDYISAFFGCLYAGAIAVPVFPPDFARQKPSLARIRTIARDSHASLALTTSAILSKIEPVLQRDEDFQAIDLLATDTFALEDALRWQPCAGTGNTLALLQYTSGSTSAPKGVMVTHNNLLSNHQMIQAAFQHPTRAPYVSWLPLFHDMGLIANVLQALYVDAPCIFMAPASFIQKPVRWLEAIARYKAHTSGGPSFAYDLCARRITPEQRAMLDLSSWKIAFNGSEPIRWEPLRDFLKLFAPCNFKPASIYPAYGLAEATVFVAGGLKSALPAIYSAKETVPEFRHIAARDDDKETRAAFVGCGRSWLDESICIVHPESQVVCLPEQVGEIWVAGPHVAMGYWNNQEATRQTFCAYLQTGEGPFLRTGDLGFIKDGELFITGRIKDLIIIHGLNYYPQDIEKTVEQCHPLLCVAACVAFSVSIENEERLVIVQEVERHASKEDLQEAIAAIRAQVSVDYGLSTYAVVLIKPRSIPKTTSGKLQHAETRRRFLEGTLDVVCQSSADDVKPETERVKPQSIVSQMLRSTPEAGQRQLIEIYLQSQIARVTNRQPASIDWQQPVAAFGLDSLMYVELINQLEMDLGVLLQLEQLLQDWTLSQLAETVVHLFNDGSLPESGAAVELRPSQELHGMYPLSSMQRSLWFLHRLRPTSNEYHLSFTIRMTGMLDVSLLERSLNEIIRRHAVLRAMIVEENGAPAMQIRPYAAFRLPLIECPFTGESECEEAVSGRAAAEARRPFDLQREPLFRFLLLRLQENVHVLLFNVHHIIFDGWSLGVFLRELATLYKGYSHDEAVALPPLTTHYGEFVSRQQKQLGSQQHDKHLAYWQQQLADIPALLHLPLDHPRPSVRTFHGARYSFEISPPLLEKLRQFSRQEQTTLFTILLAAFQTLLFRYSGQADIVVGMPILGRTQAATRDVIGLFVNTLAIRTDFSAGSAFLALLQQVKSTLVAAYAHADVPFDMIVEAIRPERDLSYTPVFQVSFAMQNIPLPTFQAGEIMLAPTEVANESAQCDLSLSLLETPTGLLVHMDYATDLFELATMQRFARHFQTLLQGIVTYPQRSISDLPLLTEEEREQTLSLWNATARPYPQLRCVHELFEEQVERTPEAVALVFQRERLTYRELNMRANQLAHFLRARGVGSEVLVGLFLERSVEMVVALLAVLKAGGAYVPLDPRYPSERLGFMLQDACMPVLLTLERYRGLLPGGEEQVISLDDDWKFISAQPSTNLRHAVSAANVAYMIYTSGSTGKPKGVLATHQGLANYLQWGLEVYTSAECGGSIVNSSLGFDLTITSLFLPLLQGRSVKLLPDEVESLAATLRGGEDFSIVKLTPTHLELLSLLLPSESLKGRVSTLIIGGEALRQEHLTFWRTYAPETRVINEYGPTETVVGCCAYEVPSDAPCSGGVPIGRPIANTCCYVLDTSLQPVPVGVVGELYIGGNGLARGYWQRPALTAERFVPDPFNVYVGARLYRTGDLARYRLDGTLDFVGRTDSQVKVRGYRIELGEIEQVLLGCEGVREAVVVLREDQPGHKTLVAYVVPDREEVSAQELRQRLQERLPAYQVPASVLLLEQFPLAANGKLDRRALPAPESTLERGDLVVAPRTPLEESLAAIWREILGIATISIYDNFLDLGGHSLLATRVLSQIKRTLQVEISLQSFFETQNLAGLASLIAQQTSTQENLATFEKLLDEIESLSDKEVEEKKSFPLSFAQQRLWFLDQLEPDRPVYNICGAIQLEGSLNYAALRRSLNHLVERHESLRTIFTNEEGRGQQILLESLILSLPLLDLQNQPPAVRDEALNRLMDEEAQRPFHLEQGPLLRCTLIRLAGEEHLLLLSMHHIISDGWSLEIFLRELTHLYTSYCQGTSPRLPALPIQYADFAVWQRQWLNGSRLTQLETYWQEQLQNATPLDFPTDYPRPAVQTFTGAALPLQLPAELTTSLKALSQHEGTTLFMTLLGAFLVLLHRSTGQEDLVVGTPIANRTQAEVEHVIGFFVNSLALRIGLTADLSFREVLGRVREVTLAAYSHQDLPFEQVVDLVQPVRDGSRSPLFQMMFVFQNAPQRQFELEGITARIYPLESKIAKFDLTLELTETAHGCIGELQYNTALFKPSTIQRFAEQYQRVLRALVTSPEQAVGRISLLSEQEWEQIISGWNATVRPVAQRCLHELFAEQVEYTPEAVALAFQQQQITYRELNTRANQLAHYLQEQGVGPEVLVGLCQERSIEMVIALLGILKAGGAYVPLDPGYPPERLAFMLQDAQLALLLTSENLRGHLPQADRAILCLDSDWHMIEQRCPTNPASSVQAENLAYVMYTSGSTGQPKSVQVTHKGILNLVVAHNSCIEQIDGQYKKEAQHVLQYTSLSFDVSLFEMVMALFNGARLVLIEDVGRVGAELEQRLREHAISMVALTPTVLATLPPGNLPDLQTMIIGGEICPPELRARWAVGRHFLNAYGPTETTVCASLAPFQQDQLPSIIGKPIANVCLYILDQQMRPVPIGVPGELYIGGRGLARGYWQRPALTAERFVPDPFNVYVGARLYRTGDLAKYQPDGTLEFVGRKDQQVKLHGFRIELGEIEHALLRCEGVREAVVALREDQPGHKALTAYVVPESEGVTPEALRQQLLIQLPAYQVPAHLLLLEKLPLTLHGKLDRRALPAPESMLERGQSVVAPRTPLEEQLATIWCEALGIAQVGVHESFFELGGDSIVSLQVVARARQQGIHLKPRDLFQYQTIAQLAQAVSDQPTLVPEEEVSLTPNQHKFFLSGLSQQQLDQLLGHKAEVEAIYPLSPLQHGMLFHTLSAPQQGDYFNQLVLTLQGRLQEQALVQAWEQVMQRHALLRSRILWEGIPEPVHVIERAVRLPWKSSDYRALSEQEQEQEVQRYLAADRSQGIDVSQAPLMRLAFFRLAEQRTQIVWSHHHLLLDGWSLSLVLDEVFSRYEASQQGEGEQRQWPWVRPYQDYIGWIRQQDQSQGEHFWQETLAGVSAPTPLTFGPVPQPALLTEGEASSRMGTIELDLSEQESRAVEQMVASQQVTLNTLVQAAWAVLLARTAGVEEVVFGTVVAGRPGELTGVEEMVGLFINTVPVRLRLPGQYSVGSWLAQVQQHLLTLQEYAYLSLPQVQRCSQVPAGTPLFESLLVFENYPRGQMQQEQRVGTQLRVEAGYAVEQTNYALTLVVVPGERLQLRLIYERARFEQGSMQQVLSWYQRVLHGLVTAPERTVGQVSLLSEQERELIVSGWNQTAQSVAQRCLHELFAEQAERTPEAVALVLQQQVTYRELNERANQLANYLQEQGVGPEVLVGVCLPRCLEMVIALLGILKAGGAYVPLDPTYPSERLNFMLQDADIAILVTLESLRKKFTDTNMALLCIDSEWFKMAQRRSANPDRCAHMDNVAYMIYTSGSTGKPKGVQIIHSGLSNLVSWHQQAFALSSQDRATQIASWSFDAAGWETWPYLSIGATVHLVEDEVRNEPERLREWLEEQQITRCFLPTPLAENMVEGVWPSELSLRTLLTGGDFLHRMPEKTLPFTFVNNYGPTESTVVTTSGVVESASGLGQVPAIGRPIANTRCYVLDTNLQPVPVGVVGELYIGGSGLARGYWQRPALTAERFVPDPFVGTSLSASEAGARLYRTGDLARYRPDGTLDFVGRTDSQVKVRGYRIELAEIEHALLSCEEVREAVVVLREDQPGHKTLVAYVVPDREEVSAQRLRQRLLEKLPAYQVPASVLLLEQFPLTANGKLDRRALPAPESTLERGDLVVAPRTPLEESLAAIWREALGIAEVGVHKSFFELGGDSIVSLQVVARARQQGIHLKPRDLFQYQTIAQLALAVSDQQWEPSSLVSEEEVPLTPIQHWFFQQDFVESAHWNQAFLLQLRQPVDWRWLPQSLVLLLRHHDALRLRFQRQERGWQQVYASQETAEYDARRCYLHIDLGHLPLLQRREQMQHLAAQAQASLNLEQGPLLRVLSFTLGPDQPSRLLLVLHHLVIDGVSWRVLLEDLQLLWEQGLRGDRLLLPARTSSYQHWASILRRAAQHPVLLAQLPYWLEQVRTPQPRLPLECELGANDVASVGQVRLTLSVEETRALLQQVPAAYRTRLPEVLLTALALTFQRWSGKNELLLHLEGHGREEEGAQQAGQELVDLSRTIGWFTTIFPLRLMLESGASQDLGATLKAIKEQARRVPQQGWGYGVLRYLSQANTPQEAEALTQLREAPEAQLSLNYLGQFDQVFAPQGLLSVAPEDSGPSSSPRNQRTHLLEIVGLVLEGRLQLIWTYSQNWHRSATIEALAADMLQWVRALMAHCLQPESGGYTPADFPLSGLSQQQLDQLLSHKEEAEAIYPLSPLQHGMLFHTLSAPQQGDYFNQLVLTLQGRLHEQALVQAWEQVMQRHALLRSRILWEGLPEPVHVIERAVRLPWSSNDWRTLSEQEQEQEVRRYLAADRRQGIDVRQAPLMRLAFFRLAEQRTQIVWSYHHLLLDGWSLSLVLDEVFRLYEASQQEQGESRQWPWVRPYQDYIGWLRQQDQSQGEHFWQETLAGVSAPTPLAFGPVPQPALLTEGEASSRMGTIELDLSEQESRAVEQMVASQQVTLNTLVQAAWAVLLSKTAGVKEVVFGTVVAGRPGELTGVEEMVGLFINTVPVRLRLPGQQRIGSWLAQVQQHLLTLQEYAYLSLPQVQRCSQVPAGTPLFESLLVFENYPRGQMQQGQRVGTQLRVEAGYAVEQTNYALTLVVVPGERLQLRLIYERARFEQGSMQQVLGWYQRVLHGLVTAPERTVGQVSLLSEQERELIVSGWNQTTRPIAWGSLSERFAEQAERTPEAVALVFQQQQVTYGELDARANQLAHHLQALGVSNEVLVGVCLPRCLEMVIALLGILKAGGAYVPLDPAYPSERLNFMLQDAQLRVLLTHECFQDRFSAADTQLLCLDRDWSAITRQSREAPRTEASAEHLAYIIYTSGSTGQPKGVQVQQGSILRLVYGVDYVPLDASIRVLQISPASFDVATFELWAPLLHGGCCVLFAGDFPSAQTIKEVVQREQITMMWLTASLFNMVIDESPEALAGPDYLLIGGEALSVSHVRQGLQALPGMQIINGYGPTENTTFSCCESIAFPLPAGLRSIPIGRPIANSQAYVLDGAGLPVPVGVIGELYLGGAGLARGYWRRPALTAERFVPDPFVGTSHDESGSYRVSEAGARLYRTGDLARYLPDGRLEFVGRNDTQVKVRGFRIELGEIETVLNHLPMIAECAVLVQEHESGDRRLVAYLVPREQTIPSITDLRSALQKQLPEYMIPSLFEVLPLLPLTPNGKVDRTALRLSTGVRLSAEEQPQTPRTPVEEVLVAIWSHILQTERVGIHDNFFTLGGHSLLATQIISRINQTFHLEIPIRQLFETQTVAELARCLETAHRATLQQVNLPLAIVAERTGLLPLSFAQQRLWFLDQLMPENPFYNVPFTMRLQGCLDVAALERSFQQVIQRHEILRTTFVLHGNQPVQRISAHGSVVPLLLDLSELQQTEREQQVQVLAQEEFNRAFDLATGPLLRLRLLRLGREEHILLLNLHHIICDAWSMGVLLQEIVSLYTAQINGQTPSLPDLPIQFADYAYWQRKWLQGETLTTQLAYWQKQLADAPAVLELPTDHPRPVVQTYRGALHEFALSAALTQEVKAFSRQKEVTLFMTLLAAFGCLLSRYSGQSDLVIGTPIANRTRSETEPLIGLFVNTLAIRLNIGSSMTFESLLNDVRDLALNAYAHQDLPFEQLVETLHPERNLSHSPLFQVLFTLQNAPLPPLQMPGLRMDLQREEWHSAKFDLSLLMNEDDGRLKGAFEYNTDLFEKATIQRLTDHWQLLLERIVANWQQRLSHLPILTEKEHRKLLKEWNSTQEEYPEDLCVHQLFEMQVECTPEAIAVTAGEEQISYRELNSRANQLAHYLRHLGVGPDVAVGLCLGRTLDMVVAILGILKAGGAYVPLDQTYPVERLALMFADTSIKVLITYRQFAPHFPRPQADFHLLCLDEERKIIAAQKQEAPAVSINSHALCYIVYTSGSTGVPKGVCMPHRPLVNLIDWQRKRRPTLAQTRTIQFSSLLFDPLFQEIFCTFAEGGSLVLISEAVKRDPESLLTTMDAENIEQIYLPFIALQQLAEFAQTTGKSLPYLREILTAGEQLQMTPELRAWLKNMPRCHLYNYYGPSETHVVTSFCLPADSHLWSPLPPIGRPIANTQVYVLDKAFLPVPVGVSGELYIGGDSVGRGYAHQPHLTAERFLPDPFSGRAGSLLYKTGDRVRYLSNGELEFQGRLDQQVKIRGYRVELGEIEFILQQHPQIKECAVVVQGQGSEKRLVAYIVAHTDDSGLPSLASAYLKAKLPEYMIPATYILMDTLPVTATGKVNRKALLAAAPEKIEIGRNRSFVVPRTQLEQELADIWSELLQVEKISVDDNFFEIGGQSLLATRLMLYIRERIQPDFSLQTIFEAPTIAALAATIVKQEVEKTDPDLLLQLLNQLEEAQI